MAGGTGRKIIAAVRLFKVTTSEAQSGAAMYELNAQDYLRRKKESGEGYRSDVRKTEKYLRILKRMKLLR